MIDLAIEHRIDNGMWYLRALAIFFVICAHCNIQGETNDIIKFEAHLLSNWGGCSVGLFLFSSGYYFKGSEVKLKSFLASKLRKIIIPWFISSTCVWLYIVLRKGGINFISWVRYVIGYKSIFYYMTDLCIIQIIFWAFGRYNRKKNEDYILYVTVFVINAIMLMLEEKGISPFSTPYLDFLIFISYFSIGMLVKQVINSKNMHIFISLLSIPLIRSALIIVSVIIIISPVKYIYWGGIKVLFIEVLIIFTVFSALCLTNANSRLIRHIGHDSFAIYLWHLPFAGIVSNIGSKCIELRYLSIMWPFFIIFCTEIVIWIFKFVLTRTGNNDKLVYLGVR